MSEGDWRQTPVRIVGAGLSGLATAWFLAERGRQVIVDEASPRAGGLLETRHTPEGLVEASARGFLWTERVAALFAAAGVSPLFADERSKRRFILRGGRPRRWPLGPIETISLVGHGASALVTRGTRARGEESVALWGERVLGRAGTTWLLGPALQGIYASPIEALSARAIFGGGRVRGKLATAPRGMRELVDGLLAALATRGVTVRFNARVDALQPGVPTIVATPAPAAAQLVGPHAPGVAAALSNIRMTNLLSVTAFYAPHPADTRGFGILFPRGAGIEALGVLFNSDMFAGRGQYRSETWIYGDSAPAAIEAIRADVHARLSNDRRVLTGRAESPIATYPTLWPQRLPVYGPAVLDAGARLGELPPWLTLRGNYLGTIGVSALVEAAEKGLKAWGSSLTGSEA
jgi:protoporphyrinogen/coproporphyrinogen III oxidase